METMLAGRLVCRQTCAPQACASLDRRAVKVGRFLAHVMESSDANRADVLFESAGHPSSARTALPIDPAKHQVV